MLPGWLPRITHVDQACPLHVYGRYVVGTYVLLCCNRTVTVDAQGARCRSGEWQHEEQTRACRAPHCLALWHAQGLGRLRQRLTERQPPPRDLAASSAQYQVCLVAACHMPRSTCWGWDGGRLRWDGNWDGMGWWTNQMQPLRCLMRRHCRHLLLQQQLQLLHLLLQLLQLLLLLLQLLLLQHLLLLLQLLLLLLLLHLLLLRL